MIADIDNAMLRRMQFWLFFVFLLILVVAVALIFLALFADVGSLSEEHKDFLLRATIGPVAAAIIALFYAVFGLKPKLKARRELLGFCEHVEGYWWSFAADPNSVGFVKLTTDVSIGTLVVSGHAYDPQGDAVASWESDGTCVNLNKRKLYYYWRGKGLEPEPPESYEGFGEITFLDTTTNLCQSAQGLFSNTNLSEATNTTQISTRWRRCNKQEINVMQESDKKPIAALVRRKLETNNL